MSDVKDKNILSTIVKVGQIGFFIIIASATIWSLLLTVKQTNLIFKPVVGIVEAKPTRFRLSGKEDNYENVISAKIQFTIQNVGNLPAKNFKIKVSGKLGKTTLASRQSFDKDHEGIILVQSAKTFNTHTINKKIIDTLVQKKERLFYTFDLSYSDWEEYKHYAHSVIYEIYVTEKEPLQFGVAVIPYIPE